MSKGIIIINKFIYQSFPYVDHADSRDCIHTVTPPAFTVSSRSTGKRVNSFDSFAGDSSVVFAGRGAC